MRSRLPSVLTTNQPTTDMHRPTPGWGVKPRLTGVDLARALAVLGMFIAHIGPLILDPNAGPAAEVLADFGNGHASILFATLAGVSLALLTGGNQPHTGRLLRRDRVRIAVRAVLLFLLGMALTQLGAPMMVILSYYALYFLLALPLLRVRPGVLLGIAALWAVLGPLLSFVIRLPMDVKTIGGAASFTDLLSLSSATDAGLRLVLTGAYPVLTWMPFVLTGLAIGRLNLRATAVRLRMVAAGVGLAILGYGGSWLAMHVFGGIRALEPMLNVLRPLAKQMGMDPLEFMTSTGYGTTPTTNPAFLLLDAPHSGTPFEIIGSTGFALAMLAICLFLGDWSGRILAPLTAIGAMALTVYTAQGIALKLIMDGAGPSLASQPWLPLTGLVVGSLVLCGLWRPLLGRGPLEWIMHQASTRLGAAAIR